ncbi:polycomb group protein [Musa troglodytarum]|uniref:Polycomb group protein n=1 Tax=Musa troglodytarum TaxID=320322 RepID=A0A9E7G9I5_9LILI|nr:polycomb group protein [Musa troglodytarum]
MAKSGLGCEPAVGSLTASRKREYKVSNRVHEGKRPLYAIAFNFIDARYYDVFATVGGNRVTVYRCLEGGLIAVLQAYVDEDKDESFYTLSWACDTDGTPFLVAGGSNGIIRVINAGTEKIHKSFVGHGDSVNEIRTQALKPSLVVSASKDESVRLWNLHTGICILVFAGAGGHRNEVLSVDFHPSDIYRIASCGMDNTVKIWSMKEFWTYVEKSFTWTDLPSKFPTKYVQFPVFIASVHSNYVDCTRWLGDFVLSKSVDNEIVLWEPKTKEQNPGEGAVDILQKYPVPECDIWFIKFSCDFHYNAATIGNREGKIFIWELQSSPPVLMARLSHAQCKSPIRQTAMSFDGSTILSCCEDGSIWRWDTSWSSIVKFACSLASTRTEWTNSRMTNGLHITLYHLPRLLWICPNHLPQHRAMFHQDKSRHCLHLHPRSNPLSHVVVIIIIIIIIISQRERERDYLDFINIDQEEQDVLVRIRQFLETSVHGEG